jgi:hypothetical protein
MNRFTPALVVLSALLAGLSLVTPEPVFTTRAVELCPASATSYRTPAPAVCAPCYSVPWQTCCGGTGLPPYFTSNR